jgi:hypothetical protein
MEQKNIMIKDKETITLYNQIKGKIITAFPEERITDEKIIKILSEAYKNGR